MAGLASLHLKLDEGAVDEMITDSERLAFERGFKPPLIRDKKDAAGRRDRGRLRHSIGIETRGGKFTPLIPKGAPLPASVTETFTTAVQNQPSIELRPFQGENSRALFNKGLGVFDVTEIPPAGPGELEIHVTFHVDAQGALSITARDTGTDQHLPVLRR
jgi:hypothetical protein